ncbi:hypothetical protein TURU_077550 [Turdus rufiventris]|nr:hypothetical protein TURU_077550 [Turdus rufiventris]
MSKQESNVEAVTEFAPEENFADYILEEVSSRSPPPEKLLAMFSKVVVRHKSWKLSPQWSNAKKWSSLLEQQQFLMSLQCQFQLERLFGIKVPQTHSHELLELKEGKSPMDVVKGDKACASEQQFYHDK